MLEQIRRNVRRPWIQAMLGGIIVVFILFFGWGSMSQKPTYVAEVDGVQISDREYKRAYDNMVRFYQEVYKDSFTPERLKQMGLGRRALDDLIDQVLLLHEADERGIEIGDEELQQAIQTQSAFQQEGRFSKDVYLRVLDLSQLTPLEFEMSRRRELLLSKTQQAIRSEIQVTDDEVEQEYLERNTKIELEFAAFRPPEFELEVEVNDAALRDFYEAEGESFRSPEKRSARHTLFSPEDFMGSIAVDEKEARDEFSWRADEFSEPETVRARHILFRVPPGAAAEDEAEVKAKAEEVRELVLAGTDFSELAKEHSEDPGTKDQGGELGTFQRGQMVAEFDAAAFSLEPEIVSEPVKTSYGYHLILVEEHKQAEEKTFEDVEGQLTEEIKRRKALEAAYPAADNTLMDLEDAETTWEALSAAREVKTTEPTTSQGTVEGVENAEAFVEVLFGLDPQKPGELLETPAGTYLVAVAEVIPSAIPPLEEIRDEVEKRYRAAEARRLAESKAGEFLGNARDEGWEEAVEAFGVEPQKTGAFAKKGGAVPKIGWSPELKEDAFQLTFSAPIAEKPREVNATYYAVRLAARTEADLSALGDEREKIRSELLPSVQDEHFQNYLEELKAKAEVEINEAFLY